MLTVFIDFKSPASYLAMNPVLALAERGQVAVDWKPFRTVERAIPTVTDNASVAQMHRKVRAASRRAIHQKYAAHQGIALRFPEPPGNTDLALGVLTMIDGDRLSFIQAAFAAYWTDHADLNDAAVLSALMSGTVQKGFDLDRQVVLDVLETSQMQAEEKGVVEAPAFFIQDQLFIGREHLPWIEEIIRA